MAPTVAAQAQPTSAAPAAPPTPIVIEGGTSGKYAGKTLSVLQPTGGGGRGVQPGIEAWAKENGVKLQITQLAYAEVRQKALLDFTSHTSTYDVVQVDGAIWASEMAPFLEPLDPWLQKDPLPEQDDFIPAVLKAMRVPYPDGTTYAVPVRYGTLIYHYRKDLFDAAGIQNPPTYWDEYLADAQKTTKDGVYGTVHAGKQGNFLVYNWFAFLYGFGGNFLTPDQSKSMLNEPASIEATQFWADLYNKYHVVPPGMTSYEHDDVITVMQQGLVASAITYSPYALEFEKPDKSKVVGKVAWSSIPIKRDVPDLKSGGVGSGWGFAINKDSANKDIAWDLIKYVSSPKVQLDLAINAANAPVRRSTFLNADYQKVFPAAEATLKALEGDRIRPGLRNWTAVEDMMAAELSAALVGQKSGTEAMEEGDAKLNDLLKSSQ
ncbi:MAG TPA: hypothetical protein DEP84_04050 [Chloroflexi bacterium]|nr:hypothetical protein [Chloroflexota bacterium]